MAIRFMEELRIQDSGQPEEVFAYSTKDQKCYGGGEEQGIDAIENATMAGEKRT
jgi:hypothetical protein